MWSTYTTITGTPFQIPAAPAVPVLDFAASLTKSVLVISCSCLAPYHASSSRPLAQNTTPRSPLSEPPGGSRIAENPRTPKDAAKTPVAVLNPYLRNCLLLITFPAAADFPSPERTGAGFSSYSLAIVFTTYTPSNLFGAQE